MDKKTPMLKPDAKKEQNVNARDPLDKHNSSSGADTNPSKEDPKKVPESNDPAGYSKSGPIKKSPYSEEE